MNDGSTDGSAAILDEYVGRDYRIKVITQPNGGLSSARNTGIKASRGDYLLFLDSDDWVETNALETISKDLEGVDMLCFSGRRFIEAIGAYNSADQLVEKTYESGMAYYNENALLHRDFAFVCVVLRAYRRSFLIDNQLLFKEGIFHEDNLFTPIACYYAKSVRQISDCLYDYRVRSNSITDSNLSKRLSDFMGIANELAAFFVPKTGFDKTIVFRAITHHYQRVFSDAPKAERNQLRQLCDWSLYRKVSRTKLRHRINYLKHRF